MRKKTIIEKYLLVTFPVRFIDNVIHQFHLKLIEKQTEFELTIPGFLYAKPNKTVLVEILFCRCNENFVKRFLDKLRIWFNTNLILQLNDPLRKLEVYST